MAIRNFGVGAFFLGGKNLSRWQRVKQIVRAWERMNELATNTPRPFLLQVNASGTLVEPLQAP